MSKVSSLHCDQSSLLECEYKFIAAGMGEQVSSLHCEYNSSLLDCEYKPGVGEPSLLAVSTNFSWDLSSKSFIAAGVGEQVSSP